MPNGIGVQNLDLQFRPDGEGLVSAQISVARRPSGEPSPVGTKQRSLKIETLNIP